jgi:hypothetical protein
MALTINQIQKEALSILEREMADATPYSLVVVTLKDGTTQEIIIKINPRSLYEVCDDIKKHGALTLTNDESGIYVPANEIKRINVMKVTKEQP